MGLHEVLLPDVPKTCKKAPLSDQNQPRTGVSFYKQDNGQNQNQPRTGYFINKIMARTKTNQELGYHFHDFINKIMARTKTNQELGYHFINKMNNYQSEKINPVV